MFVPDRELLQVLRVKCLFYGRVSQHTWLLSRKVVCFQWPWPQPPSEYELFCCVNVFRITKGHHPLSYRLARVLLEKSPYYPTQPSNFGLTLSVPSGIHPYLDDIDSLKSDTVPEHPVSRPPNIIAFTTELDRGPVYSAFDSDSYRISIDSMASACMSAFLEDFAPATL